MTKQFAKRVSKRDRKKRDLVTDLGLSGNLRDVQEQLLKGAEIETVKLEHIEVRAQVRTKFNDDKWLSCRSWLLISKNNP